MPRRGDIEDIFDPEIYAVIVNRSYALPEPHQVTVEKLGPRSLDTTGCKEGRGDVPAHAGDDSDLRSLYPRPLG